MGDYFDMVSNNTGVHLAWANTLNGEEDVYYSFITPPASTGMEEVAGNANVFVYPNPTSGLLEVSCRDQKTRLEVFTTIGQKVFSTADFNASHAIDLSSQPAGIYFLKLMAQDHQVVVKKIIRK